VEAGFRRFFFNVPAKDIETFEEYLFDKQKAPIKHIARLSEQSKTHSIQENTLWIAVDQNHGKN
jgi:hypothetical protein